MDDTTLYCQHWVTTYRVGRVVRRNCWHRAVYRYLTTGKLVCGIHARRIGRNAVERLDDAKTK